MVAHNSGAGEFDLIEKYFKNLASKGAPAFALTDDAAVISLLRDKELVITTDTLVAGVHFFGTEDAKIIARKAVRVNLSDLASMGAKPYGYLVSLALPDAMNDPYEREQWVKSFTQGLQMEQDEFGWMLLGGDTVKAKGSLTISITALGTVGHKTALHRFNAVSDDLIYVSGTLGDSALGLIVLQGILDVKDKQERDYLIERYHLPRPRVELGMALVGTANSAIDISDGLAGDLAHICKASGLGAQIFDYKLPISVAAGNVLERNSLYKNRLWNGGDDYELLFTVPEIKAAEIEVIGKKLNIPLTRIGSMTHSEKITMFDNQGKEISFKQDGYRHF